MNSEVLTVANADFGELASLLRRYSLQLVLHEADEPITATFWGEPEAGIAGDTVYVRRDTPLHSVLHETGHIICMTQDRRGTLIRDAGGDDLEEAGVCYLQIVLADFIDGFGRAAALRDMDTWGYSFRLGSARKWFEHDAEDARQFLINQCLLTDEGEPIFALRR